MASGWKTWGHNALCYYIAVLFMHITSITADVIVQRDGNITERFLSMPSNFGSPIPDPGLTGVLFIADPINACERIAPPPVNRSLVLDYLFVLIFRGNCEFDYKVFQAQLAGYDGAIVYNDHSNGILSMTGSKYSDDVYIPSVFVGHDDGLFLYEFVYGTEHYVTITRGTSLPWGYYLYPFITVLTTCFIFSCFYGVTKFVRDRRRLRRIRLSRDHLKKLPVIKFKKGDERYDCCAICLDDYEEGNKLRVLPCQHAFHCKCIDPWLTNNRRTCPICKRKVVPAGVPDSDAESDDSSVDENTPLLSGGTGGVNRSSSRASPTPDEMLWGAIGGQREPSPEVVLGPPANPTVCESYDSGIVNNSATERDEDDGALELAPSSRDQGEENGPLDVLVNVDGSENSAPVV